jgi:hypothetical protein
MQCDWIVRPKSLRGSNVPGAMLKNASSSPTEPIVNTQFLSSFTLFPKVVMVVVEAIDAIEQEVGQRSIIVQEFCDGCQKDKKSRSAKSMLDFYTSQSTILP